MSSDLAIIARDISKAFRIYDRPEDRLIELASMGRIRRHREFQALRGVNLEVHRGETVGIVGRNGCGKSTLLQVICGILQPTAGTVTTHGRIAALLELGAGFDGNFTGRENVYLNGAIHDRTRAEMDERFEAIAAFADIGDFLDRPVKTYSSGMFVRLAFATAVNIDPDILVVDEALAVGDEAFQRKCYARIEQIKERGATILFVSHAAQTIIQLCDRAVLIDGGEKLMEGAPISVIGQYQRLVNAPPAQQQTLRCDIANVAVDRASESPRPDEQQDVPDPPDPSSAYDHGLQSQSAVAYERRGAEIRNLTIATLDGREVNVLRMGRRYVVRYEVHFDSAAINVGFGMHVKSVEGTGLAGIQTVNSPPLRISLINPGDRVSVSFEFLCAFVPGVYFLTCGIIGTVAGEKIVIHRLSDWLAFRVAPELDLPNTGHLDIGIKPVFVVTPGGPS
jgi:lipopolysaccharide transport system ATP-binding protein